MGLFTLAHITLAGIIIGVVFLMSEPVTIAYRRWGEHLRPTRHPWVWGISGYIVASVVLDLVWPWRGWSYRVVGTLLFIGVLGVTGKWAESVWRRR
jgi:hypothetical protein